VFCEKSGVTQKPEQKFSLKIENLFYSQHGVDPNTIKRKGGEERL